MYSDSFDALWFHRVSRIAQTIETIPLPRLQVPFDVEMRVTILLVQPSTFSNDPVDVMLALPTRLLV